MSRVARILLLGLPAIFVAGVAALGASQDDRVRIEVCRHKRADSPGARAFDPAAPSRAFASQVASTRERLTSLGGTIASTKPAGYDVGLPGCGRQAEERIDLDQALPEVFRSRTLYFVCLGKGGQVSRVLAERLTGKELVFALSYSSLSDVGTFAKKTGANISIGTAELARKFRVRCADTRIEVSLDGKTLHRQESVR